MFNYEFSRIIFKLVWARCPPVVGLESAFVFHLMRTAIYYARSFITFWPVILWCRKNSNWFKGMLNSRYVYNKLCNLPPSVITSVPCDRILKRAYCLERFSFQCQKVIGFAFTTLRDWLKKLAPLFRTIRSKTNTNSDSLVRVFPRFASATCNYFVFWLVHLITCVLCDWLEWLLWFWFYDTQLKTALKHQESNCWGISILNGVSLCSAVYLHNKNAQGLIALTYRDLPVFVY